MTSTQHAVVAYVLGLALLWGYALSLWLRRRALMRNAAQRSEE